MWNGTSYWMAVSVSQQPFRAHSNDLLTWTIDACEYSIGLGPVHIQPGNLRLNTVSSSIAYLESDDFGKTWSQYYPGGNASDVVFANGKYVGCFSNYHIYSTDKKNWTSYTFYAASLNNGYSTIDFDGTYFKAAGNTGWSGTFPNAYSFKSSNPNGASYWAIDANTVPVSNFKYVGTHWFGNYYLYNNGSSSYALIVDGLTQSLAGSNPTASAWRDYAYGNGTYVAVGDSGNLYTTTDPSVGSNWVKRTTYNLTNINGLEIKRVAFGNGVFVAVGNYLCNYSYDNGVTWQYAPFPSNVALAGMVWNGSKFIAISTVGSVYTLVPPPP